MVVKSLGSLFRLFARSLTRSFVRLFVCSSFRVSAPSSARSFLRQFGHWASFSLACSCIRFVFVRSLAHLSMYCKFKKIV